MKIRTACETDFLEFIALSHRTWPEFDEREAIYHILCKYFTKTCFAAEDAGAIRGFLLGFISQQNRKDAYIHLIVVDRAAQRGGVASRLYERFFKTVRGMGVARVRLTVAPTNAPSPAFHRQMGFRPEIVGECVAIGEVAVARDFNGPGNHMVPFLREI